MGGLGVDWSGDGEIGGGDEDGDRLGVGWG